jgi:hypothetical protein
VIESAEGANAGFEHGIDHTAVVVKPFLIRRSGTRRLDAWPRNREAITFLIKALKNGDVPRVKMVMIAGDIASSGALDLALGMRKPVPDGLALASFLPCALNLVGSRRHAPQKPIWKATGASIRLRFA